MADITQERLKELILYCPDSGEMRWKVDKGTAKKGEVAGCNHNRGYRNIAIDGKLYLTHRLAWLYEYGKFPDGMIDHVNKIKTDNRINNLRDVTSTGNLRNMKRYKSNTSGRTGVYWNKPSQKWQASIGVGGTMEYLGLFDRKEDAILAREEAEQFYGFTVQTIEE